MPKRFRHGGIRHDSRTGGEGPRQSACLFCGGDMSEPDHWRHCDGRQGMIEETIARQDADPDLDDADDIPPFDPGQAFADPPEMNLAAAVAARDDAIGQVDAAASVDFQAIADDTIAAVANDTAEFTSDDVWSRRSQWPPTRDRRAMGPALLRAERRRLIAATGRFTRTSQVNSHASPARIWRSLVYNNGTQ